MPTLDNVPERFRGHWQSMNMSIGFNTHDNQADANQRGGVVVISLDMAAHKTFGKGGSDPLGLGWWAWTCHRGKSGVTVRVVSGYRPCNNRGEKMVWAQHCRVLDKRDDDWCPR